MQRHRIAIQSQDIAVDLGVALNTVEKMLRAIESAGGTMCGPLDESLFEADVEARAVADGLLTIDTGNAWAAVVTYQLTYKGRRSLGANVRPSWAQALSSRLRRLVA